jgi:hypothetical protein
MGEKLFRVIIRAREDGGYRYQIFAVGGFDPRPSQSDNVTYVTREDAERAGQAAAAVLRKDQKDAEAAPHFDFGADGSGNPR